ncbi:MAG: hypothetical protein JSS75_08380 [Bacteroidetes bacterium]|nr:hypothetical protein [Bacteroidota bacterium]
MQRSVLHAFLCIIPSLVLSLTGCAKKGSDAPGNGATVFDSSEKASPVAVNDANHRFYFRLKAGDTYRYKVQITSTADAQNDDHLYKQFPASEKATSVNTYYIRQTVKEVTKDSTIDFSITMDSVSLRLDKDTLHVRFSSNDPATRNDPRFQSYMSVIGMTFGVKLNKLGDVLEVYNTADYVNKAMKTFPDSLNTPQNRETMKKQIESTVAEYLGRTMVRFPDRVMAKDSSIVVSREVNAPIWNQISFPMRLDGKTVMDGFQERSGKVLASFTTKSTVTPIKDTLQDPAARATLGNMKTNVTENVLVEDATGMLVHREIVDERGWEFKLEALKKPENYFKTRRASSEHTTVDLLK